MGNETSLKPWREEERAGEEGKGRRVAGKGRCLRAVLVAWRSMERGV